jgi:ubiquinone/menaquinone biosynthesis C-methylase UbiE/uncharacterized protein YbaR (Trm112 family)
MNIKFLELLCDPNTHEALTLEVVERIGDNIITGNLASKSNNFPIIRGVPRFNFDRESLNYTKSFGYQWNKWPFIQFEDENRDKPMQGHTLQMFKRITHISPKDTDLRDQYICDIGCGSGRFLDLLSDSPNFLIGIDSSDAVEAASKKFELNPNVLICQADVLNLPLASGSIDQVYSIGVLHHTSNPRTGVNEISRILKPMATASLSVYGKGGYYDDPIVEIYRKMFKMLWPLFGHRLPLIYSILIVYITRPLEKTRRLKRILKPLLSYFPHIQLADIKWSILDTFDSITPSYQKGISYFELFQYMSDSNISSITPVDWGGTALRGIKTPNK